MRRGNVRRLPALLLYSCLAIALVLGGCEGCDGDDEEPADTGMDVANDVEEDVADDAVDDVTDAEGDGDAQDGATATLNVEVFELDGPAVVGATVTVGDSSAETDDSGRATFDELEPGEKIVRVSADGYAESSERVDVPEDTTTVTAVTLVPSGDPQQFDPTTDTELFNDRVRVSLPADSLVDADGNTPSGEVEAIITPLNPSGNGINAFPGDTMGMLEGESEPTPFESIFLADFEFRDGSGQPLQLADGSTATLEYVLPDDLQEQYATGDQIEAWFFDTDGGTWRQEGMGEVIESTYAADRLAWTVDVEHFSWWNCDAPISDRNCVTLNVAEQGSGDPVSGAQVVVEGVSYNGYSTATTGPGGDACVDFKLGATAEIRVGGPNGSTQAGGPTQITGNNTPAACSGAGAGSCQTVTIQMAPPTCLSGAVVDSDGNPRPNTDVSGRYSTVNGDRVVQTTTDANGSYCLRVPQGSSVEVTASYTSGGTFNEAKTTVAAGSSAASCGGGNCTFINELKPEPAPSGCINGGVSVETTGGVAPANAGTNVYLFAEAGDTAGSSVNIDCSQPPSAWGTLISQTTTNASGEFCVTGPVSTNSRTLVIGKCGSSGNACLSEFAPTSIGQTATCGSGNCTTLTDPIFLGDQCGNGP